MIQFAYPQLLWLLAAIPLLLGWYSLQHTRQQTVLQFSSINPFRRLRPTWKQVLRHSLILLRMISYGALVIAVAQPQVTLSKQTIATEGIDIVLAFDISGSMLTRDFVPNRLEAAKKVADDFIDRRPNDRIGAVFFTAQAYTGSPVTIDHNSLKKIIDNVQMGLLEDGTAIGMGLGTAVNRLKESPAGTKIIILVTDGENNAGEVKPIEAAQYAKSLNIRVYSIGILAPVSEKRILTAQDSAYMALGNPSAETTLSQIAQITGGKYFRATNEKSLDAVYKEIDQLEKTKVNMTTYRRYENRYFLLAVIAFLALLMELLLRYTVFKTIA